MDERRGIEEQVSSSFFFFFASPLNRMQIRLELSHVNAARKSPRKDVYQSRSTSITFA